MSTGRTVLKEFYVGFLLFLLTFLYLSHLSQTAASTEQHRQETVKAKRIEIRKNFVRG